MKKLTALTLSLAMAATLLAGCQSSTSSSAPAPQSTPAQEGSSVAASAVVEDSIGFPADETITLIVPGKAGGGSDLAIRYIATALTNEYGLTTTVSNYDSNTIGHQTLANSANDGTYVTLATAALNIQYITGSSELNPLEDFTLIAALQDNGFTTLAVPADAPYDTFEEFVAYAKENPGMINAGQPANGNNTFAFGMLESALGVDFNAVECASESDRLTNLSGGFIDVGFVGVGNAVQYSEAGKIKILGTLAADGYTRDDLDATLPDNFKTLQEQGFENCVWGVQHYLLGPAGMDAAQVEAMNAALKTVMENAECSEGISSLGQIPEWHDVAESHEIQQAEFDRLVGVAKDLGTYVNG